jgi:hypothetical protein
VFISSFFINGTSSLSSKIGETFGAMALPGPSVGHLPPAPLAAHGQTEPWHCKTSLRTYRDTVPHAENAALLFESRPVQFDRGGTATGATGQPNLTGITRTMIRKFNKKKTEKTLRK